jgi:hypothetical protein
MEGWNHAICFRGLTAAKPIPVAARSKRVGLPSQRSLGLRVRIPLGIWMSVSCERCVL